MVNYNSSLSYLLLFLPSAFVNGHGYMQTPRTRNRFAAEDGSDFGGDDKAGVPLREYCAHCLNRKAGESEVCGTISGNNYDVWNDVNGNPMPWISQEVYREGQEIVVDGTLTTNHAGHMEIYLCPMGRASTRECLYSNPATFVSDPIHDGPVDANYPERAYFSNDADYRFIYKLPDGLVGDEVLVQWRYITANSCIPPGYREDPINSILKEKGWLRSEGMGDCPWPTNETGEGTPEQFWNCAEISIVPATPTTSPRPTLAPISPAPISSAPVEEPTMPTPNTTPTPPPYDGDGYCNWNDCNGEVQGGDWCNENEDRCVTGCGGKWCSNNPTTPVATPTMAPGPTPTEGYCNWGDDGTGDSSTCNGEVQGGEWCNQSQSNCEDGCNGKWCTNVGPPPTGPAPTDAPEPTGPTPTDAPGPMTATTTRYWDCSGGSCGCAYLIEDGNTAEPAHCYSNAMFAAPTNNAYGAKYYGTAAVSQILFDDPDGDGWLGNGCGKCYRVTGTSNTPGNEGSTTTTLVLKAANYCPPGNPLCSGNKVHFDIAAPGFDVVQYSLAHVCPEREPEEADGFQSCSKWMIDSQDPNVNCDCSKFTNSILRAGCENFYDLQWDNAVVTYEPVLCPQELDRQNCWEENGNSYPPFDEIPQFCASNLDETTPTNAPVPEPTDAPVPEPTDAPVPEPTDAPVPEPTDAPVPEPTDAPVPEPTDAPDEPWETIFKETFDDVEDATDLVDTFPKGFARVVDTKGYDGSTKSALLKNKQKLFSLNNKIKPYTKFKINFYYYAQGMEANKEFKLEYKLPKEQWKVAQSWNIDGTEKVNGVWYEGSATYDGPTNKKGKTKFRFVMVGTQGNDRIYLDDITFSGMK